MLNRDSYRFRDSSQFRFIWHHKAVPAETVAVRDAEPNGPLILLAAATTRPGFGEEGHVDLRDSSLKAAVEKALGMSNPTADQMLNLTRLEAKGLGIVDLRGLEYAVNLAHLDLRENKINDISVLGNLTKLTRLWLADNQVTDIHPLSSLTNLKRLFLFRNRISDISAVSELTNLRICAALRRENLPIGEKRKM